MAAALEDALSWETTAELLATFPSNDDVVIAPIETNRVVTSATATCVLYQTGWIKVFENNNNNNASFYEKPFASLQCDKEPRWMAISPDGRLLACSFVTTKEETTLNVYDIYQSTIALRWTTMLPSNTNSMTQLSISKSHMVAVVVMDATKKSNTSSQCFLYQGKATTGQQQPVHTLDNVSCCGFFEEYLCVGRHGTNLQILDESSCQPIANGNITVSTNNSTADTIMTSIHWIQKETMVVCVKETAKDDDNVDLHLCIVSLQKNDSGNNHFSLQRTSTVDLGDVVPFFDYPGFHTYYIHPLREDLLVVASNLGNDVYLLSKQQQQQQESWHVLEPVEYSTPVDDKTDQFLLPTGLAGYGGGTVLLTLTDARLVQLQLTHATDPSFFSPPLPTPTTSLLPTEPLPPTRVEEIENDKQQEEKETAATPFAAADAPTSTSAFGSGGAIPVFGHTSTTFGSGNSPPLLFGQPRTLLGGSSVSSPAQVTFGSGGSFGTSSPATTLFGANSTGLSFGALSTPPSSTIPSSMIQPLFGAPKTTKEPQESDAPPQEQKSPEPPAVAHTKAPPPPPTPPRKEYTSNAAKKAATVFDGADVKQLGSLGVDQLETLVEELGEGFHGDELDQQRQLMDPNNSGSIHRDAFVHWYETLVSDDHDESDLDSEDRAEREEERQNARRAFFTLANSKEEDASIAATDFPRLFELLNTVYCDEEHKKNLTALQRSDGRVHLLDFADWYVNWIFAGDEESIDDNDKGDTAGDSAPSETGQVPPTSDWGSTFSQKVGSWKCSGCLVTNDADVVECPACGTFKPGHEVAAQAPAPTGLGSIGSGGFNFGSGTGTTSGGFGSAAPAASEGKKASGTPASSARLNFGLGTAAASTTPKPGFSFGEASADTAGAAKVIGFSFGGAPSVGGSVNLFSGNSSEAATETAVAGADNKDHSNAEALKAGRAFDQRDKNRTGKIPVSLLTDLLEDLGEGLFGDELDAQIALLDSDKSGEVSRSKFVSWYCDFVNQTDDDSSLDSDEKAEREEERENAREKFMALIPDGQVVELSLPVGEFPKLIESLGTTYCEEQHKSTVALLGKSGAIGIDDFVDWYEDFLFRGDEDSIEEEDREESAEDGAAQTGDLSALFASTQKEGSWKCDACFVQNDAGSVKCISCETPKPGAEAVAAESSEKPDEKSTIGPGGFSFVPLAGNSKPSGEDSGKETGGSSFGAAATGFPFGSPSAPTTSGGVSFGSASDATSTGSAFGTKPPSTQGRFPFGAPASASKPAAEFSVAPTPKPSPKPIGSDSKTSKPANPPIPKKAPSSMATASQPKPATSSSAKGAYPPMPKMAPRPVGGPPKPAPASTKSATTKPSSSAYPPMSKKAPTPVAKSKSATTTPKPDAGAYPPMSKKAPTPVASAPKPATSKSAMGYPPMSRKAPTPVVGQQPKPTASAFGSAFPSLSGTGQKPVGLFGESPSQKNENPFAAFSKQQPSNLFGSPKDGASGAVGSSPFGSFSSTPATKTATASSSVFPSTKPSPSVKDLNFSSSVPPARVAHGGPANISAPMQSRDIKAASPEHRQYLDLAEKMQSTLERVSRSGDKTAENQSHTDLTKHVDSKRQTMFRVENVSVQLSESNAKSMEMLSKLAQVSKNVDKAKAIATKLQSNSSSKEFDTIPLDLESESIRRKLTGLAIGAKIAFDQADNRRKLTMENSDPKQLLGQIVELFERSKALERTVSSIRNDAINMVQKTHKKKTAVSPAFQTGSKAARVVNELESLETAFKGHRSRPTKVFSLQPRPVQSGNGPPALSTRDFRRPQSLESGKSSKKLSSVQLSQPLSVQVRGKWNLADSTANQTLVNEASFAPPKDLKDSTVSGSTQESLVGFGTTPESLNAAILVNKRGMPPKAPPTVSTRSTKPPSSASTKGKPVASSKSSQENAPQSTDLAAASKALIFSPDKSEPKAKEPAPAAPAPTTGGSGTDRSFANISSIGMNLFADKKPEEKKAGESPNYRDMLVKFYKAHNPSGLDAVDGRLAKYKGHEKELFARLAKKYNAPNPLEASKDAIPSIGETKPSASPFAIGASPSAAAPEGSPFGNTNTPAATQAPAFGSTSATQAPAFGSTGFGSPTASTSFSPFSPNASANPAPTPTTPGSGFAPSSSAPSPVVLTERMTGSPREILTHFYQKYNPEKLPKVESLLIKYQGREQKLLQNLANTYKFDPSMITITQPTPVGIGSPTGMSTPGFGQPSALGGGNTGFASPAGTPSGGFGAFGSAASANSFGSSSGFGALAQGGQQGFGSFSSPAAPSPSPFGSSTPFGAPRR